MKKVDISIDGVINQLKTWGAFLHGDREDCQDVGGFNPGRHPKIVPVMFAPLTLW